MSLQVIGIERRPASKPRYVVRCPHCGDSYTRTGDRRQFAEAYGGKSCTARVANRKRGETMRQQRKQNAETGIMRAIREALAIVPGVVVWRNNVGAFGATGAKIFYGLAPGSADLVGVCSVELPGFSPHPVGRFFALEVKTPDGHTAAERVESQARWAGVVRKHGGFYAQVHTVAEALDAVRRCREGAGE